MIVNPHITQIDRPGRARTGDRRTASPRLRYAWSHYLAFGHVPRPLLRSDVGNPVVAVGPAELTSGADFIDALADLVPTGDRLGLMLGGGIGSAILAALVPSDTMCFTVAFDAPGSEHDALAASQHASRWGLRHEIVPVRWSDHVEHARDLMRSRRGPLQAAEVSFFLAARRAGAYGIRTLLLGTGASSVGAVHAPPHLDSGRYPYVLDPAAVLEHPADVTSVLAPYQRSGRLDVPAFRRGQVLPAALDAVRHGAGAAGLEVVTPFAQVASAVSADIDLTRGAEPPDLVAEAFALLDRLAPVPDRVAFTPPVDVWLAGWDGPLDRPEFRVDVGDIVAGLTGTATWLLWCLGAHLRTPAVASAL